MKIVLPHLPVTISESRLSEMHEYNRENVSPYTDIKYISRDLHTIKLLASESVLPTTPTITTVFISASTALNNVWAIDYIPLSSASVYHVEKPFPSLKFRQSSINYRHP